MVENDRKPVKAIERGVYRLRNGLKAEVQKYEERYAFPYSGVVYRRNEVFDFNWKEEGYAISENYPSEFDLVELIEVKPL